STLSSPPFEYSFRLFPLPTRNTQSILTIPSIEIHVVTPSIPRQPTVAVIGKTQPDEHLFTAFASQTFTQLLVAQKHDIHDKEPSTTTRKNRSQPLGYETGH
ncbi:unnamed protein product, partial [Ectocarpus sp. 8 AP-2014]